MNEEKILKELKEIKEIVENLRAIVVALAGDKVNSIWNVKIVIEKCLKEKVIGKNYFVIESVYKIGTITITLNVIHAKKSMR